MIADLFVGERRVERLGEGALLLRGFACEVAPALHAAIAAIAEAAPFRRMMTPGRRRMSAAMTSCGRWGWTSGPAGYAYRETDPESGRPWPAMPVALRRLAIEAAAAAGYPGFDPDGCLVNLYEAGARMGLHQDRDEADAAQPIVSVSLGLPAIFLWGGARRDDPTARHRLEEGDVVVWGGPSRLAFHGVGPPIGADRPGACRLNLTFRRAR